MRHFAVVISLVTIGTGVHAQSLDWQGLLQRGVNEVIRSIDTPPQAPAPPVYKPAPVYKSAPSASRSSPTHPPAARPARKASKPQATQQTVDARIADNLLGDPAEFRRFFDRLKREVAAGQRTTLAKMMNYPLSVSGGKIKVFSDKDFLAHYDSIFTPSVVAAVQKQTYETLFVRDSGASVGNGLLWFSGACVDSTCGMRVPKVVGINPPEEEMAAVLPTADAPASTAKGTVLLGASLPEGASPGPFGPCRQLPAHSGSGSMTISGAVPHDATHCYRLAGKSGQNVHIELKSVNTGFNIVALAENRYDLKFKAKNRAYDIMLAQTLPGPGADHYELHITLR